MISLKKLTLLPYLYNEKKRKRDAYNLSDTDLKGFMDFNYKNFKDKY